MNRYRILSLSAVLALVAMPPSYAGFAEGDAVNMGGEQVFRIQGSAGGFSSERRAWHAQDALDNALVLAGDRTPEAVKVGRMNGAVVVLLDGRKVATADANSAQLEGLTAEGLAQKWADGIKNFLADSGKTNTYLQTLITEHELKSNVLLAEKTLYVPAGFMLPITLSTAIAADTAKAGDRIEATVTKDVMIGHFAIPEGSLLIGEVIQGHGDTFGVSFATLKTPGGKVMPINATVADAHDVSTSGPHLVSTYVLPAGMVNGYPYVACRVPSSIGVGTRSESGLHVFAFQRDSGTIAVGRPMHVVFDAPTQVAVVVRGGAM